MTPHQPFTKWTDRRCSLPDCNVFHYAKGLCKKHYMKQFKLKVKNKK